MYFLNDKFYIEHITQLYQNYLNKFKVNKNRLEYLEEIIDSDEIIDVKCTVHIEEVSNKIKEFDLLIDESEDINYSIKDSSSISFLEFSYEDSLFFNKLPIPQDYLDNLIKEKVDYNFKNLSNYRIDRSYFNRILKGNIPSKNTLISIGYFLNLNLEEMSELLNVYGFAFGNSTDDRVVYFAFSNSFKYDQFLEFVDLHGSNFLKKFFSK